MEKYNLFIPIYKYIENIVNHALETDKKIIVWGGDFCGLFIRHLDI